MSAPLPTTVAPSDYRQVELPVLPALAQSYRRAVAGAARAAVARRPPSGLTEVVSHGPVTPDGDQLAAYQHLIGASGTDELPAGYVHVLGFPLSMALMTRRGFPLPLLGLIHIANRVTQTRALRFEEPLRFAAWADELRPHRRGTLVDVHLTAAVDDDVVWAGVSTYLAKGVGGGTGHQAGDGDAAATADGGVAAGEGPDAGEASTTPASQDASTRRHHTTRGHHVWTLPADTGRRYAEVSGDRNPIHTSRLGAKAFGLSRPIAHGMYTAARALASVPRGDGPLDWAVAFGKPVLLPAKVSLDFETGTTTAWTVTSARSGATHLTGHVRPL